MQLKPATMSHPDSSFSPKRRRTESHSPSGICLEGDQPVRSSEFWLEDGNVILQAQNVQFRVYRGIIARHSKVFRDMFELSQPSEEALTEGCPVIHLTDSPKDWENILSIVCNNDAAYKSSEDLAISQLLSMFRLGRKYEFNHLLDEALGRLRLNLPNTLDLWEKTCWRGSVNAVEGHEIDLVNVLLEMEIQSLLPVAYYLCVQNLSLENIFRGTLRPDGTTARLLPDSIEKVVLGRERISKAIWAYELGWGSTTAKASLRVRDSCETHGVNKITSAVPGPNAGLAFLPSSNFFIELGCIACQKKVLQPFESGRRHIWEKLPTYFDLPLWKELKDV